MWSWLKKAINDNTFHSITLMGLISGGTFAVNLLKALSDGTITDAQWHNLMTSANGVEAILLGVIAIALKLKDK